MWSVVEKTALAEAEVEYEDYVSDQVWVKFPVRMSAADTSETNRKLASAAILIWTTTPWTIPGNRAISFSRKIEYGLYEVLDAPSGNWAKPGDRFVLADKLAVDVFQQARVTAFKKLDSVSVDDLAVISCEHPLKGFAGDYDFQVPLLAGDHVTDDAGTGFVHTAPGHGREDFDVWTSNAAKLAARGINTTIPYTVDEDGTLHRSRSRLHRQACAHRQGRKGRCQRGRHQGADRRRHAARARPAQAPVSAFLALEKAGDLPQHAAMVHCDGQADRRTPRAARRPATRCGPARSAPSRSPAGCRSKGRTASPAWSRASPTG